MTQKNLSWSQRDAKFATVLAAPAFFVIAWMSPEHGLAFLFGMLPAAILGLSPKRKQRKNIAVIGVLFGLSLMLGSAVAPWWWIALPLLAALAYGAAQLAATSPFGMIAMTLAVPLTGIGLSYSGLEKSASTGLLLILGSVLACLLSLLWPEYPAEVKLPVPLLPKNLARDYGFRLALTAVTAAGTGYALGIEHIGWITGAALMVIRPQWEAEKLRAQGRILSVVTGALLASLLLWLDLPDVAIAVVAAGSLVVAAATHKSRWYVTPAFTTFLVFWLILIGDATASNINHRFWERVLETVAGVLIACFYGLVVPQFLARPRTQPNK